VHAIIKRALSADPAQRFASMGTVAAALARDRRRARVFAIVVAALVAGGVIGGVAMRRHTTAQSCESARLPQTWSAHRAQKIRGAFGDAAWAQASVDTLDTVAKHWGTTYHAVCAATRVRGEQSDRLLELRMRCLDRALDRFDALATALEKPLDNASRAEAASAIAQLPHPEACRTLVDAAELALPTDSAQRTRVIELERASDRAWADYALGRYREARDAVVALETQARPLDAPGLHAGLAVLGAAIESRIGEPAVGRARLERALAEAAKAHAYELEHVVWTRMLRHELFAGNPARVLEWEKFARAAALHAGLEGAEIDGIVGEALRDAGQPSRARDVLLHALESNDPLRTDQRAIIEMNLGSVELAMGQAFLAEEAFKRALELARAQLGDGHPSLAIYRDKLAEAERARGRIASALAHHDASIALRTAAYGDGDRSVATARFHRAETLIEAGQLAKAATDLDAARAIRTKIFGERSPRLGEIDVALGDIALARGKKAEALARYDGAVALDPRLDVTWRRWIAGGSRPTVDDAPPSIEPFSVERAPMLAERVHTLGQFPSQAFADQIATAFRSAHTDDPTLAVATGDALTYSLQSAKAVPFYRIAIGALAKEPSRMRLRALRGLINTVRDPDAQQEAAALAKQMPELAEPR
jgi:tetratricopeptide (TPR) repeat protein